MAFPPISMRLFPVRYNVKDNSPEIATHLNYPRDVPCRQL